MLTEEQSGETCAYFNMLWRFRDAIACRFSVRESRHLMTFMRKDIKPISYV